MTTRRVSSCAPESDADEVVERIPVGAGDFEDAADWLADRGAGDGGCDVVGRHRLAQRRRDPHGVAVGRRIGDAPDELEELGRAHDRERDGRFLDELFLCVLGAEVAAGEQPVGSDDGQCDQVRHPGRLRCGEHVAGGGGEEVPGGPILEGRGVGDVDDDLRAGQRLCQTLTGEGVDTRVRRGCDRLVTVGVSLATTFEPMSPVPPMTTTFMMNLQLVGAFALVRFGNEPSRSDSRLPKAKRTLGSP